MPTTVNLRKILDRKQFEFVTPSPVASSAGVCICSSRHYRQQQLLLASNTVAHIFNPYEDGFVQIPSPALAGTFGAGAAAASSAVGPSGTATGGSTTTVATGLNLRRDLRGYSIHITGGPGAGDVRTIASNTLEATATITVTSAFSTTITSSSTYRLLTPRWYVVGAGTLASGSFKHYDLATNTWTTLVNTGLPATIGTDSKLISTPSWILTGFNSFATGTATAGAGTTLTNSGKAWTTNQWANYQVRITAGTGLGQIRTIASNTGTVLTVSAAWTTNPDATSQYSIEGNDDFIYYMGSNAVTLYRYSISANTWTTLSPGAARAAAPGAGMSGHWVYAANDADWTAENAIRNGRRIYSFRGGGSAVLDYYDIAANTWVSGVPYSPLTDTFTTGTKYVYYKDFLYITKENTGRWFKFNIITGELNGWGTMLYPQGAAVVGDTAFDVTYVDGETEVEFIYMLLNTSSVMLRQFDI
jgi:hypothetical protein